MHEFIDVILDNIAEEKCILILGPDISVDKEYHPNIEPDIIKYINSMSNLDLEYDADNFIIFKKKSAKTFFFTNLKKYYETNLRVNKLHELLSLIPFHLYISLSPDLLLKAAFDNYGIETDFKYYNKSEASQEINKPSIRRPLIYNLFGSIKETDSLIVTYDDLFNFIFSVIGDKSLPKELRIRINSAKIFLFLGCDFEKWYMKLILRLFNLHGEPTPFTTEINGKLNEQNKIFFINNFEMQFFGVSMKELVETLYSESKLRKMLREKKTSVDPPIVNHIRDLIKENQIEEAIGELDDFLYGKDEELRNHITQISGLYNSLKRQIAKGMITKEEMETSFAKLRNSILLFTDELKNI
jgi:hypothetical protein